MNIYIVLSCLLLLFVLGYLRSKRAKNKVAHVIEESCTGCQRCLKKCRHKALETVDNEKGKYIIIKYPAKCTACGDCIAACKFNALELVDRKETKKVIP